MCMLTYVPHHHLPDRESLQNGADQNRDGHGWAQITDNGESIAVFHSLDATEAIDSFMEVKAANRSFPGMFHSRIGTSGLINQGTANLHPFFIGDEVTVLGHNGILPQEFDPVGDDPRSDTAILCDMLADGTLPHLSSQRARKNLGKRIARGYPNKLVILTVEPVYKGRNSFIINADLGVWDGGVWYSNSDYLGWSQYYIRRPALLAAGSYQPQTLPDRENCMGCNEDAVSYKNNECWACGLCQDCGGYDWDYIDAVSVPWDGKTPQHCMCYNSSSSMRWARHGVEQ